jgi:hypothetical protein
MKKNIIELEQSHHQVDRLVSKYRRHYIHDKEIIPRILANEEKRTVSIPRNVQIRQNITLGNMYSVLIKLLLMRCALPYDGQLILACIRALVIA